MPFMDGTSEGSLAVDDGRSLTSKDNQSMSLGQYLAMTAE